MQLFNLYTLSNEQHVADIEDLLGKGGLIMGTIALDALGNVAGVSGADLLDGGRGGGLGRSK